MITLNKTLLQEVKQAFVPMPGGAPPADPSMGGAPPMDPSMGGMPADPSMGGAPPMDPSMGGMPADPSMGGAPPMDPSMMDPNLSAPLGLTEKGLIDIIKTVQGLPTDDVGPDGAAATSDSKPAKATNQSILEAINSLSGSLGIGAADAVPAGMKTAAYKNNQVKIATIINRLNKLAEKLAT